MECFRRLAWLILLSCSLSTQGYSQQVDPSFAAPGVYQTAGCGASLLLPTGKRLLSGWFTRVNGQASGSIIRVNPDGTLDPTFVTPVGDGPSHLQLTPSGKILVFTGGGVFKVGNSYASMLQLNADGSPDYSFYAGSPGGGDAYTMQVQADGKILVGGTFTSYAGQPAPKLVRLLPSGDVDASFNIGSGPNGLVDYTSQLPDGKILVGGNFTSFNGQPGYGIVRLLPTGAVDATFRSELTAGTMVQAITRQPDGRLLLAGNLYMNSSNTVRFLIRFTADGAFDPTFQIPFFGGSRAGVGVAGVNLVRVQPDGGILVGGSFTSVYNLPAYNLVRLQANGSYDASLAQAFNFTAAVNGLELDANGNIALSGVFNDYTLQKKGFALLQRTGTELPLALPLLQRAGTVAAVVTQPDGKLLVAGRYDEIAGRPAAGLARLLPNGAADNTFQAAASAQGEVNALAVQPDGSVLVGGGLVGAVSSYNTRGVVRLLPDGSADNTFSTGTGFSGAVNRLFLQPDGKIIAGGSFGSAGNMYTVGLARLQANGAIDATFHVRPTDLSIRTMHAALQQPDGKVVVAGFFNTASNSTAFGLMRYQTDGSEDPTFANGARFSNSSGYVPLYGLAQQPDGKLLVGGEFTKFNGQDVRNLLRLLPSGQLDPSFVPATSWRNLAGATVQAIAVQPNGRILTSGTVYTSFVGGTGPFMARFNADGTADESFSAPIYTDYYGPYSLNIQPSGAVLLYGSFARLRFGSTGSFTESPLVRIDAGQVLRVGSQQNAARTEAWPVPAHTTLNLRLDAAANPRQVTLLDALGRPVLSQPVTGAELSLPVQQLGAGVYLLRVEYASGPVTRQVVVE